MTIARILSAFFLVASLAASSSAGPLVLSIQNGVVSLDAQDVTVRQILSEWARIGHTEIVNAERIVGGPVTLKFDSVPEKQALDIVLRAVPGYVAAHRAMLVADASIYDRILIMPTTIAVAAIRQQPQQPSPGFPGLQGGANATFPGLQGGANATQLRPGAAPFQPGVPPQEQDPDDANDPAIAAAAAAGLIPAPARTPTPVPGFPPVTPDRMQQQNIAPNAPQTTTPLNPQTAMPLNAPIGTPQPTLAPPPAPVGTPPMVRPQPPQADR
jgi:hypothetical protein